MTPESLSNAIQSLAAFRAASGFPRLHVTSNIVYQRFDFERMHIILVRDLPDPGLDFRPEGPHITATPKIDMTLPLLSIALAPLTPSLSIDDADALCLLFRRGHAPLPLRRRGRPLRVPAMPPGLRRRLATLSHIAPVPSSLLPETTSSAHARLERARLSETLRALGNLNGVMRPVEPDRIGLLQTEDGPVLWTPNHHCHHNTLRQGGIIAA